MNSKIIILLGLAALVAADTGYGVPQFVESYGSDESDSDSFESGSYESESYESVEAKYDFDWGVKNEFGNSFGHDELRDNENTKGSYYNQLPDGRLQKVTYYVNGDSGYIAEVTYEGEAQYPSHESASYESDSESDESYEAPQRTYYN